MSPNLGSVVLTNAKDLGGFHHVVFHGVYNSEPSILRIAIWLPNLQFGDSALVVADNAFTDNSLEKASDLVQQISHQKQRTNWVRGWLLNLLRLVPRNLRTILIRGLVASSTGRKLFKSWDFDWNRL